MSKTDAKPDLKAKPAPKPAPEAEVKLSLEDTISQKMRGVAARRTAVAGYNPYDADPAAAPKNPGSKRKHTDLRKLSEWIRLKREVELLNQEAPKKKKSP